MAIYRLYSKRKIEREREADEVYFYDEIPRTLRSQLFQIFLEAFENEQLGRSRCTHFRLSRVHFQLAVKILRREYGVDSLVQHISDPTEEFLKFLKACKTDQFLDCAELLGRAVMSDEDLEDEYKLEIIQEINHRFMEAALGYEFVDFEIIRIDSGILHSEVLKPTLLALSSNVLYEGANEEIRQAFEKYRSHDNKGAIVEALKAFESTMKAILEKNEWPHSPGDPASKLIAACFENGLLPPHMRNHVNALKNTLETGVPVVRNKTAGHGQGAVVKSVEGHMTSYVLYTALANMKLFIDCDMARDSQEVGD